MPKKIFIYFSITLILAGFLFFVQNTALADTGQNIAGWAWSENIGWISFNSTSDGSSVSYGVNIDPATGDFSGYAWSENIGWISFNRSDTGNPPAAPFNGGSGPIAKYDLGSRTITGWMRALATDGGWDGWINFRDASIDASGEWHGWAWSDIVVGWVSLNGSDPGAGGNYKVVRTNFPPTATNLSVSSGSSSSYCGSSGTHTFNWTYSDPDADTESRFEFQVDNNSGFGSPEISRNFTGLSNPSGSSNTQSALVVVSPGSDQLAYNTTYYWRVRVYDSEGYNSGWVSGPSFSSEPHRYPSVNFNWSPQQPPAGTDTLFSDQSVCYDINNNSVSCSVWSWTFEAGNPSSSSDQNPVVQFGSTGAKAIVLQTTDPDGYNCNLTKSITIKLGLPGWKEVSPR